MWSIYITLQTKKERSKLVYEDAKALKKLENDLFKILINIIENISIDNKYKTLTSTTLKPRLTFPNICFKQLVRFQLNKNEVQMTELAKFQT